MFRNPSDAPQKNKTTVNCLITDGGLGDLLCSLMAVNYIIETAPWVNLLVFVPDYMKSFTKHVLPKHAIVRNFSDGKDKYDDKKYGITTKWTSQHTPMRTHGVDYSFHMLADYAPKMEEKNYLKIRPEEIDISKFDIPEKFVVLPGAATEKVKSMPIETFNKLKNYVVEKGYTPVVLGKTENQTGVAGIAGKALVQDYDFSECINLIDKTNLLESTAIIAKVILYIGMDSGLTHLAGFTDTKIVCGYTFITPESQMPIRNDKLGYNCFPVEPDSDLGCRGCQSKWTLMFNHDFRDCFYKDLKCVSQITFEKFKNTIESNNLL